MPIQPQTFITRVREHSELSPMALLVALTIAELRYGKRIKPHEPLPLTMADLADACHMSPRGVCRYIDECIRSGWIVGRKVYRNGRQQPNEYFLCDPTDGEAECRRVQAAIASGGQLLPARVARNCDMRLQTVRRSSYNGVADDAPLSGGGGNDEQGQVQTAGPDAHQPATAPALEGAGPATDPVENPKAQLEEQTEPPPVDAAVWAQWDRERLDAELAELMAAPPPVIPKRHDPLAIPCPEPDCPADAGEPCPGYKLRGVPHSTRRIAVYATGAAS